MSKKVAIEQLKTDNIVECQIKEILGKQQRVCREDMVRQENVHYLENKDNHFLTPLHFYFLLEKLSYRIIRYLKKGTCFFKTILQSI